MKASWLGVMSVAVGTFVLAGVLGAAWPAFVGVGLMAVAEMVGPPPEGSEEPAFA